MAAKTPGTSSRSAQSGTAGVLQVNPALLQPQAAPTAAPAKPAARLKVTIRRLPPCLTREEFQGFMGDEWKVGAGKVDWLEYRAGKIRSPGKLPEQSRVSLHLLKEAFVSELETRFMSVTFHDAKASYQHSDLKQWLPVLEYAPYQRIPPSKSRQDNRQGLIDQDPEYMAFLEGETQPQPKSSALDAASAERIKEIVKTTPLIEALRERKAAKAKSAATKAVSKKERDDIDTPEKAKSVPAKAKKDATASAKATSRAEAKVSDSSKSSKSETPAKTKDSVSAEPAPAASRRRDRAPASIKSLLERDLGLAKPTRRAAKDPAPASDAVSPQAVKESAPLPATSEKPSRSNRATSTESKATQTAPATVNAPRARPSPRPAAVTSSASATTTPSKTVETSNGPATPAKGRRGPTKPTPGAKKAYIKHVNASQGIIEPDLRAVLTQFGDLTSLDIDKRKGTAMVEFKLAESLAAAVAKRSITIAQGAVEVLEYKERNATANTTSVAAQATAPVTSTAAAADPRTGNAGKNARVLSTSGTPGRALGNRSKGGQGRGRGGARAVSEATGAVAGASTPAAPAKAAASSKPG